MDDKTLGWVAGFLEGEGSFLHPNKNGSTVVVCATQVQLDPLERLKNLYGGSIYLKTKTKGRPNEKPRYVWTITGKRAANIMWSILSIMSPRRQYQIYDSLGEWMMRDPQNKDKTHCKYGHEFTIENTRVYTHSKTGRIGRYCRACKRIKSLDGYYKTKSATD